MPKIIQGWWLPVGGLLCAKCDYQHRGLNLPDAVYLDYEEGNKPPTAICEKCGSEMAVTKTLAHVQKLALGLKEQGVEARIWHTGGGFFAVGVEVGEWHVMASADDENPEGFVVTMQHVEVGDLYFSHSAPNLREAVLAFKDYMDKAKRVKRIV